MKKITYFCIILCFSSIMTFLWNCTDPDLVRYSSQAPHKNFSIEEAKEFFEKQTISHVLNTRAKTKKKKKKLSTGDITPIWDDAVASSNKNIACYDIPIESDYKYKAVYSDYYNGKASAKKVNVYQKLIVVKDVQTQQIGQYILTLIPDKEYEDKYRKKVGERFINCKNKLDFTGVAIYTIPNIDLIIRVNHYTNGVKDQGVYLPGKPELLKKKLVIVRSMLKNILIKHKKTVATRSWGEDDWDDWDDWDDDDWLWDDDDDDDDNYDIEHNDWDKDIIDEWENNGGTVVEIGDSWIFIDENGDWFAMEDSDGNGNPDCVIITPDPDTEDDPDIPEDTDDGAGNNGGGDGDNDDYDDYGDYATNEPEDTKTPFDNTKDKLNKAAKESLGERKFTIKEGNLSGSNPAVGTFDGSTNMNDVLYNNIESVITVNSGLTDTQRQLVMAHEYVHIILLEESRLAGNATNFEKNNKELYDAIMNKNNLNEGHHEYMGGHTDIMEKLLREAFPGESDDFYNCGKWAGGATNSNTFLNLPKEEQKAVLNYLRTHKL